MVETSPSTIEQDIAELEHKLEEKKAALEHQKSEKELVHGLLGEKIKEHVPQFLPSAGQPITSPSLPTPPADGSTPVVAEPPSYLSQELKDKIKMIVKMVFDKNLDEGIREAAKTGNMALIDAFHDILTDELYSQLIEKRKLKKVDQ